MSASLVGSEMCIRDRATMAQFSGVANALQNLETRTSAQAEEVRTYLAAVSYTHLTLPTICSV
eukprot:10530089-Alexandrium_andersonii.AAC.1